MEQKAINKMREYAVTYKANRGPILFTYRNKGLNETERLCAGSHIPIIAAYGFLYEETNDSKFIDLTVKMMKFLGI